MTHGVGSLKNLSDDVRAINGDIMISFKIVQGVGISSVASIFNFCVIPTRKEVVIVTGHTVERGPQVNEVVVVSGVVALR